ncbi:hypothetical protein BsWGS_20202 [Bradybaena similaris]
MAMATFKKSSQSQVTGEATINKLPEHILLDILSFLSIRDRCRSRRVCSKWKQILSDDFLWRHVDLLEFPISLQTLWRLVRAHFSPRMSTLKIRGYDHLGGFNKGKESISEAVLKRIAARCPNLQVLHLMDCDTKTISFESLPTSIVGLEMVHCLWKPGWMTDKQNHLPKLEHLSLDRSVLVQASDMEDICVWRNLKYLSISTFLYEGNSCVTTIATNLKELEYLNICGTDIDDDAVYHIAQHLKKLKYLCLGECFSVTDNGVAQIATGLPLLNKLDISHCCHVTMRGLETLFGGSIRELVVVGLTDLSEKEKKELKKCFAVTQFR